MIDTGYLAFVSFWGLPGPDLELWEEEWLAKYSKEWPDKTDQRIP